MECHLGAGATDFAYIHTWDGGLLVNEPDVIVTPKPQCPHCKGDGELHYVDPKGIEVYYCPKCSPRCSFCGSYDHYCAELKECMKILKGIIRRGNKKLGWGYKFAED